jgi:hypothetical protein
LGNGTSIVQKKEHIMTDWAVGKKRIGKHVPTNPHPTIEGSLLLGNRPVNTSQQRLRNNRKSFRWVPRGGFILKTIDATEVS